MEFWIAQCMRAAERERWCSIHFRPSFHTRPGQSLKKSSMASIDATVCTLQSSINPARCRDDHHQRAARCGERSAESSSGDKMELKARCLCFLVMLLVTGLRTARGAGECGRVPVDRMALKLAPCAAATQNPRAAVAPNCCAQVRSIGRNPKCLCAVMLSNTARQAGVKPAVAMTIPKRCAIANRPIGYKCGPYTLP